MHMFLEDRNNEAGTFQNLHNPVIQTEGPSPHSIDFAARPLRLLGDGSTWPDETLVLKILWSCVIAKTAT